MIEVIRVRASIKQLADTIIQAKAKDAQLMFCLSYLMARSLGDNTMRLDDAAAKVNVSAYTYQKWIRKLAKMRLLRFAEGSPHVWNVEIGDVPTLDPKRVLGHPGAKSRGLKRRGKNATAPSNPSVPTTATATPTRTPTVVDEDGGVFATSSPPTTPSVPVETLISKSTRHAQSDVKNATVLLSISEKSKYDKALIAYQSTVNMKSRGEIATALHGIVKNPLFSKLNLVDEIQNADAWLTQSRKTYKDMTRYFTNWLRTAANGTTRRKPRNANEAPSNGKYDTVQKPEEKKQEALVQMVWPE